MSRTFRTVLCAVDLSPSTDEAFREADALARWHQAKLVVFHVFPQAAQSSPLFPQAAIQQEQAFVAYERHVMEQLLKRLHQITGRKESEVELKVGSGSPHAAIVAEAEALKADAIVVGASRGPHSLLGPIAERVVRYAHAPVWVSRQGWGPGPVIVGTDFSPSSGPALELATQIASHAEAKLLVVHALSIEGQVPSPGRAVDAPAFPVWTPEDVATLRTAALARLEATVTDLGVRAAIEVSDAKPAAALVSLSLRERARIIVVGTAGHTGLARVVLGSVAEDVVRRATCPVLVAR